MRLRRPGPDTASLRDHAFEEVVLPRWLRRCAEARRQTAGTTADASSRALLQVQPP